MLDDNHTDIVKSPEDCLSLTFSSGLRNSTVCATFTFIMRDSPTLTFKKFQFDRHQILPLTIKIYNYGIQSIT